MEVVQACSKSVTFKFMKWLITILLFLISTGMMATASISLQEVLKRSITPGEWREDLLDQNIKLWEGRKTLDGLDELFNIRIGTKDGFLILSCAHLEKRMEVPRDQIAGYLLERAQQCGDDTYLLMRYLDYLGAYDDDPRIPKYCASLLTDKRRQSRNLVPIEGGNIVRVCDIALKNLIKWLEKQNLVKWDVTPGFIWDALRTEDFDHNIVAIRPYLIQTGVITDNDSLPGIMPNPKEIIKTGVRGGTPAALQPKQTANVSRGESIKPSLSLPTFFAVSAAFLSSVGVLWLLIKRKASSNQ